MDHASPLPRSLAALPAAPSTASSQRSTSLPDFREPHSSRGQQPAPRGGDFFSRTSRVQGQVVSARDLDNSTFSSLKTYCVVKGIRANNHLVDVAVTSVVRDSSSPIWSEDFSIVCPESWGFQGLVGLKFLVYNLDEQGASPVGSDDFLGGVDVDLSSLRPGELCVLDFELEATHRQRKGFGSQRRKPHLMVSAMVFTEEVRRPQDYEELQLRSMQSYQQVTALEFFLREAVGLARPERKGRGLRCVVRAVLITGAVLELHRTAAVQEAAWQERVRAEFLPAQEPVLILFDILQGGEDCLENGEHLGSAWASAFDLGKGGERSLELRCQLLEGLLTREGFSMREGRGGKARRGSLQLECVAQMQSQAMPLASLLQRPQEVVSSGDVEEILMAWEGSRFRVPRSLQRSGQPDQGWVYCLEHVVFVSGVVHGALQLQEDKAGGKASLYCVVEALSKHGQRLFVHRTRCSRGTLCPQWHEAFFSAVPEGGSIRSMLFSIFDGERGEAKGIGFASIDFQALLNGVSLREDVPLVGTKVRHRPQTLSGSLATHFRRVPSLALTVRCEKRARPYFERATEELGASRGRHTLSRSLRQPYWDVAEQGPELEQREAESVWHLHTTQQLASLAVPQHFKQWLAPPKSRQGREELEQARAPSKERSASKLSAAPPLEVLEQRPGSKLSAAPRPQTVQLPELATVPLPELNTTFEMKAATSLQQSGRGWLQGLHFHGDFQRAASRQRREMHRTPRMEAFTQVL